MESRRVGLHGFDFGTTKNKSNCSGHGGSGVTDGCDRGVIVRLDGEHRNALAAEFTSLFENSYLLHHPRPVAVRFDPDSYFVSCEWSEALARLDISRSLNGTSTSSTWRREKDDPNSETVDRALHSVQNRSCHVSRT